MLCRIIVVLTGMERKEEEEEVWKKGFYMTMTRREG
jgi:hypothetical protein